MRKSWSLVMFGIGMVFLFPSIVFAQPAYTCSLGYLPSSFTSTSGTVAITEGNPTGVYDTTDWKICIYQSSGCNQSSAPVVATDHSLSHTFSNLLPSTNYDVFATRRASNGSLPPVVCGATGQQNDIIIQTLAAGQGGTPPQSSGSATTPPATGSAYPPYSGSQNEGTGYTGQSPYITPFAPDVNSLLKEAAVAGLIIAGVYFLF